MLRVLFIILAVVAISLAIGLQQTLLYGVAAALLLGAAGLFTLKLKKQHADVPETYMQAPPEPVEELSSLGISDIRPKDEKVEVQAELEMEPVTANSSGLDLGVFDDVEAEEESTSDEEDGAEEAEDASVRPGDVRSPILGKVRTRKPRARIMVSEASPDQNADVLIPALRSLRAGLDAYTVCLMRQAKSPLRYHIEAIVSQNSYARSKGFFAAKEPLLAGHKALVAVVYPKVGAEGFPKSKLGYYHEPISVRQVAMVPVMTKKGSEPYLLVVDTMNDGGLESAPVRVLLEQYARLFGTILDAAAEGGLALPGESAIVRPRREIIADEMERARSMSHPLALALVFLNRGEEMDESATEELEETESLFEARLREVANDGRVERFGELTYGVFYHGASESVPDWAGRLHASFKGESTTFQGGVSVGVALLNDRHDSPDDFRSDATAALQEAFETGECTIVE